jgi:NADPH2:quinone reductase
MTASSTSDMRAAWVPAANALAELRRLARPVPAPGEVLVRIHASGVNPLDTKIRAGQAAHARQPLPAVLGMDLAGVVEAVGDAAVPWRVGDEVYGFTGGIGGVPGSLADYAAVDARLLARKPVKLSMREAAALPLVFITAWEGLVDRARVQAGHRVLVHGGAGGVGHVAVQLARARGAEVFATGTAAQADLIRAWGAEPIDFATTPVEAYVAEHTGGEGFDIVFDTVGGAVLDASFLAARRHTGHVVSSLGWGAHSLAPLSFRGATYSGVFTLLPLLTGECREHHGQIMAQATALAEAGRLKPLIDPGRYGLGDVDAAHARVATGQSHGKVVVDVLA